MADNKELYTKDPGRNKRFVRRASRAGLRPFVYATMRWLQTAPTRCWNWDKQPVELKTYLANPKAKNVVVNCDARWLRPNKEIRGLVAESGCPIEVLAIAAWDIIRLYRVHVYGRPFRRKAYLAQVKKRQDEVAQVIAAGGEPSDQSFRAFEHYLSKNYGYVDADDLSLPFYSERLSQRPERIRGGDFGKPRWKRRKRLDDKSRVRWPRPSDQLMDMPKRMCTYWRKHPTYAAALKIILTPISARRESMNAEQDMEDSANETQHTAAMDALLPHEGFASGDQWNP